MAESPVKSIKTSQKESVFFREISQLFMETALDEPALQGLTISRVKLSPDGGLCTIYFYTSEGLPYFERILPILKLYKPSLRKALATKVQARYTPELIFKYDEQFEKQLRLEGILEKVKAEDQS